MVSLTKTKTEPNRRRFTRRAALREAVKRDILNLFRFKLAQIYMADGLSLGMVARTMGASESWLYHLNNLYKQGGYDLVAPHLENVFPRALSMDIFDLAESSAPLAEGRRAGDCGAGPVKLPAVIGDGV